MASLLSKRFSSSLLKPLTIQIRHFMCPDKCPKRFLPPYCITDAKCARDSPTAGIITLCECGGVQLVKERSLFSDAELSSDDEVGAAYMLVDAKSGSRMASIDAESGSRMALKDDSTFEKDSDAESGTLMKKKDDSTYKEVKAVYFALKMLVKKKIFKYQIVSDSDPARQFLEAGVPKGFKLYYNRFLHAFLKMVDEVGQGHGFVHKKRKHTHYAHWVAQYGRLPFLQWQYAEDVILSLGVSSYIIHLSDDLPETKQLCWSWSFKPAYCKVTIKVNGITEDNLPRFIFGMRMVSLVARATAVTVFRRTYDLQLPVKVDYYFHGTKARLSFSLCEDHFFDSFPKSEGKIPNVKFEKKGVIQFV